MASIAPTLLAADFARLGQALEMIGASGAARAHIDVADGHFLPEITVGAPVVASLRQATRLWFEVHLAIERPERFVADFAAAGADAISVPAEAAPHLHDVLAAIRARGKKAGVTLDPATAVDSVADILGDLDSLSIVSGGDFGGMTSMGDRGSGDTALLPQLLVKLQHAAQLRAARGLEFTLQVEGGVTAENLTALVEAGADILVVGSAIFDSQDPKARLAELISLAGGRERSRAWDASDQ
ncbi:MAG TPA: ribulose-phosphate 3-epimerase [Terriglobia bacterium]|nr:ribulose-phosphate 3-epimerase [Terriglobia bacterium]